MNTLTEKELENLSVGTLLWVGDDGKEWVIKRFLKYLKENKSLPVRVSDINDTSNLGYKHSKMCFVKNPGNYNTQKKFTNAEVDQINLQESLCTCRCTTIVPKESEYIKTLIITDNNKYEGE